MLRDVQTPHQLAMHLRALRAAKGLSQSEVAAKLGLSQARVARIEKDPLSIRVEQLLQVLAVLDAGMVLHVRQEPVTDTASGPQSLPAAKGAVKGVGCAPQDSDLDKSNAGDW